MRRLTGYMRRFFCRQVLEEYEATKRLEDEAVESAISAGLDFDADGQVRLFETKPIIDSPYATLLIM